MTTQQAEPPTLINDPSSARRIVDTLPVKEPSAESLKSLITDEHADPENPLVKTVLTLMTWTMYAVAVGAVVLMIRAAASSYLGQ